jgi:hypothetical protein
MKPAGHKVIYTHGGGRLGNQVLRFAHWIAWARAHPGEVEVVDLAFWPFADDFAVWRDHPGCVFPLRKGREDSLARWRATIPPWMQKFLDGRDRLPRVVQAWGRWRPGWQAIELDVAREEKIDLDDAAFLRDVRRSSVTTCHGWRIASWRRLGEQEAELREFFRPAAEHANRAAAFISSLRQEHDVVAGLLIRQSDYRWWREGRFYFSTEHYVAWIRQLLGLYGADRVAVVIASEEWQDPTLFAGLPCHFATGSVNAGGPWFESWVELSLCDFVMSAPSTFSATAAFLGGVPLWPLGSAEQTLAFEQLIPDGLAGAARHREFSCAVR